jgi:ankyrin repeat protein
LINSNSKNKLLFNIKDVNGETPLMKGIINGNYDIVKIYIKYSNLSIINNQKQNIFHICAMNNNSSIINLFQNYAKSKMINEGDVFHNTPLKYSIVNNNLLSFKFLCYSKDIDVNVQDKNGDTILHLCFKYNNYLFAKYLIEYKGMIQ